MKHPLQCRCGTIKGHVERPGTATRGVCYCRDCQAFAHFLGRPGELLDAQAGSHIVALPPSHVHFSQGLEALACMSLSPKGMLRWYASCCNTPIGNTPRNFKTHYVGLLETCLASASPSLQESFGPVRMVLNTKFAAGPARASGPASNFAAMVRLMKSMVGARLSGAYKRNPFFDTGTGTPVRTPRELTEAERKRMTPA